MQYLTQNTINDDKINIKKALNFADINITSDILLYYRDILNINIKNHKALLDKITTAQEPYKISHLDVSGKDITALGFDGKQVGEKLNFLLQKVIIDPTLNNRQKLLKLICN